jgi:hypothetical protein
VAGPDALFLEVFLVVLLCTEELRRGNNLGHDGPLENPRSVQRRKRFSRISFLLDIMKENRGSVLGPVIRPLAVELGRVVALKENG